MERRICGARIELHPDYSDILRLIPGDLPRAEPDEVHPSLHCDLEAHTTGTHYGLARHLPLCYPAEVWMCWLEGQQPSGAITLADCCAPHPEVHDEVCLLFNGHAGAHSWQLTVSGDGDPRTRLGLL